jgi:membrane protein implicated in regulation of membrane protease activity
MADEDVWKRRFLAYSAVRLGGLVIFFLGIAIAYGNVVRPGGWPQLGAIIAILGALDTVLAPRLLKKAWDERDRSDPQR